MEAKLLTAERFVDMRTECMYRYVHSDTEYFRPHYHDYYEVFLVLDESAQHMVNGTLIPLHPGDMVFIRPQDIHDYACIGGKAFSMLNITFTSKTLDALFSYLGTGFPSQALLGSNLPPSVHLTSGEFDAFCAKMKTISAIPLTDTDTLKTALRTLLFHIFTKYFSNFTSQNDFIPLWLEELCSQMRKKGNFIEGSEKMFSLSDKSREHICRSMKKYMGVTVSEFINDLRLNYVANMLSNSNHTITEIIFESGFNNISWANELFKKKYGSSMRQFRNQT